MLSGKYIITILNSSLLPVILAFLILIVFSFIYALRSDNRKLIYFLVKNSFPLCVIIFILAFVIKDTNVKQALFTFSSVYFAFWLSEKQKERDIEKIYRLYLGLLWQELRFNKHQLKDIKKNYSFITKDFDKIFYLIVLRFSNIHSMVGALKSEVYSSFISSSSLLNINDELFNDLELAYNDIKYLQAMMVPAEKSFENTLKLLPTITNPQLKAQNKELNLSRIIDIGTEIAIAHRNTTIALAYISKVLKSKNISEDFEDRDSVLLDKDKRFVQSILREDFIDLQDLLNSRKENK